VGWTSSLSQVGAPPNLRACLMILSTDIVCAEYSNPVNISLLSLCCLSHTEDGKNALEGCERLQL
jgi:hypothetical protein